MTSCDGIRDRLVDLIEGELAAGECRGVEAHLAQCRECAREARALQETLARLRRVPEPAVPERFLDGFSAAVQRRIAAEKPPRLGLRQRVAAWLGDWSSLRPVPALSAAAALGLLLAVGLLRTPRGPASPPVPEVLVVTGETLSIAQNLDVLESFDLLDDLDLLEQFPRIQAPESGRPLSVS
jgi:anti-sigma factor RsiW